MAVTDHDTVDGLAEAESAARTVGMDFVTGIELSVWSAGEEIHLLAYGFDAGDPVLSTYVRGFREDRLRRADEMLQRFRAQGVPVPPGSPADLAGTGVVGRVHVAQAVVRSGGAATVREVFDRWLADGRSCHVPMPVRDAAEAMRIVREAGGITALAHPGDWTSHRTITTLVAAGIDGLEVWHPSHDTRLVAYYLDLADRYGLVTTGGSDFHVIRDDSAVPGSHSIPEPRVSLLRERLRLARRRAGRIE